MSAEDYRAASLELGREAVTWVQLSAATVLVLGTALLLVVVAHAVKALWS